MTGSLLWEGVLSPKQRTDRTVRSDRKSRYWKPAGRDYYGWIIYKVMFSDCFCCCRKTLITSLSTVHFWTWRNCSEEQKSTLDYACVFVCKGCCCYGEALEIYMSLIELKMLIELNLEGFTFYWLYLFVLMVHKASELCEWLTAIHLVRTWTLKHSSVCCECRGLYK